MQKKGENVAHSEGWYQSEETQEFTALAEFATTRPLSAATMNGQRPSSPASRRLAYFTARRVCLNNRQQSDKATNHPLHTH
jgi:hypothetical protein